MLGKNNLFQLTYYLAIKKLRIILYINLKFECNET